MEEVFNLEQTVTAFQGKVDRLIALYGSDRTVKFPDLPNGVATIRKNTGETAVAPSHPRYQLTTEMTLGRFRTVLHYIGERFGVQALINFGVDTEIVI